jgi:hypothetical protein
LELLLQELAAARRGLGSRTLAVRVELSGRSAHHAELIFEQERLVSQLRLEAHALGSVYIESLKLSVQPALELERLRERKDVLGEVFAAAHARIAAEEKEGGELALELFSGLSGVPAEVRRSLLTELPRLLEEAEQLLMARLLSAEEHE